MTRWQFFCGPVLFAVMATSAQGQVVRPLAPGQYVWDLGEGTQIADIQNDPSVRLSVSLAEQQIYVYQADRLIGSASVSTGKPGHTTPKGVFPIMQKRRFHRSNKYSNAPMPYMQRLTWTGIALHSGHNPGRPASHGCIRLPNAFARDLFAITRRGTLVTISEWPDQVFLLGYEDDLGELELAWSEPDDVNPLRLEYATETLLRY